MVENALTHKHFSFLDVNKTLTAYIMTTLEFSKTYPKQKYDYIYS